MLKLITLNLQFSQRAAAEAIALAVQLGSLTMVALDSVTGGSLPIVQRRRMVASGGQDLARPLLDVFFETNPLSAVADSVVRVQSDPLEVHVRPAVLERLGAFFTPPQDTRLEGVQEAASSGYESLRQSSKASMAYAIATHKTMLLDISLGAPTIILPAPVCNGLLIVDLGKLMLTSTVEPRSAKPVSSRHAKTQFPPSESSPVSPYFIYFILSFFFFL